MLVAILVVSKVLQGSGCSDLQCKLLMSWVLWKAALVHNSGCATLLTRVLTQPHTPKYNEVDMCDDW
jgi:hypothetical protein